MLRDYGATGGLVSDGNTNVSQLLSVAKLAFLSMDPERSMNLKPARPKRPTQTTDRLPAW